MSNEQRTYDRRTTIVFTSRVADFLVSKGEELLHVRPDIKNPSKSVFVFLNSPTMGRHLDEAKEVR
jgi:hypothetical protein